MKDRFYPHGSTKWTRIRMKIHLVSFDVQTLFFLTKFLGLMNKAIKLLLTEFVGQCRNILPLAFSALTSLRSVSTEKAAGNIFLH